LACAECDDSLPFSAASSIIPCHILFPATLLHQLFFHEECKIAIEEMKKASEKCLIKGRMKSRSITIKEKSALNN
jgi:hypothetical protein